jgi:hypothetical protein
MAVGAVPVQSVSGQFTALVVGRTGLPSRAPTVLSLPGLFVVNPASPATSSSETALDPAVLVISCERIKESLLQTLGMTDQWRNKMGQGRINLIINPAVPEEEGTLLTGLPGANGWNYELALPSPIKPRLLLRAIVKALLVEMANRSAGEQSAEIPDWLVAGLSALMQADSLQSLVIQPQVSTVGNRLNYTGLAQVREQLRQRRPLSFQELSLPEAGTLDGENYEFFSACSHLFLEQLLRLDDGRRCLREMIVRQLPAHLNWQTAFLEAYSRHFPQLLDVEKWWGLTCVSFTGTDASARFSQEDTWKKMQEALDVPVEVRLSADEMPVPAELTLQEVIADWDPAKAAPVLQRAAEGLALLRMQSAPEFAALLDRYLATLQSYLSDTRPDRPAWTSNHQLTLLGGVRNSACRELTRLDEQRAEMRPNPFAHAPTPQKKTPGRPRGITGTDAVKNNLP